MAPLCSLRAMKWRRVKIEGFCGGDVSPRSGFGAFRVKFSRRNALHFDSLLLVKNKLDSKLQFMFKIGSNNIP